MADSVMDPGLVRLVCTADYKILGMDYTQGQAVEVTAPEAERLMGFQAQVGSAMRTFFRTETAEVAAQVALQVATEAAVEAVVSVAAAVEEPLEALIARCKKLGLVWRGKSRDQLLERLNEAVVKAAAVDVAMAAVVAAAPAPVEVPVVEAEVTAEHVRAEMEHLVQDMKVLEAAAPGMEAAAPVGAEPSPDAPAGS